MYRTMRHAICRLPVTPATTRSSNIRNQPWLWTLLLSLWAFLCWPSVAWAVQITERAYWQDTTGAATWAQAKEQTYTAVSDTVTGGYSVHPTWIRLRIAPSDSAVESAANPWVLRIRPAFLDTIELYDPHSANGAQTPVAVAGDRHPPPQTVYRSIHHGFVIPASAQARDVWLRLRSTSSHVLNVQAYTLEQAIAQDRQQDTLNVVMLTLQSVFLLWAVVGWWSTRDSLLLWFIHKQLWILPYLLLINGYPRLFWGHELAPATLDWLTNACVLLYTSVAVLFDREILKKNAGSHWSVHLVGAIWLASPLAMGLLLLGHTNAAMQTNVLVATLAPPAMLLSVWATPNTPLTNSYVSERLLLAYYTLAAAPLLMTVLPLLGFTEGGLFVLDAVYIHTLLSGLLLLAILHTRTRAIDMARIRALGELAVAEQQATEQKERREDMSRFFSMLTHEMRTPLAVIKMVLPTPSGAEQQPGHYIHRAVQDIDNLIDRCIDVEKIDSGTLKVRSEPCDLVEELHNCLANLDEDRLRLTSTLDTAPLNTDPRHVHTILNNLLSNALRYSPAGSVVDVGVAATGVGYRVSVSNTSSDDHALDRDRVFTKYYRSAAAHRLSGAGLGLYVVHRLAAALGGRVSLEQHSTHRVTFHWDTQAT